MALFLPFQKLITVIVTENGETVQTLSGFYSSRAVREHGLIHGEDQGQGIEDKIRVADHKHNKDIKADYLNHYHHLCHRMHVVLYL